MHMAASVRETRTVTNNSPAQLIQNWNNSQGGYNQGCGVGSPVIRLRLREISIIRLRLQLRLRLRTDSDLQQY